MVDIALGSIICIIVMILVIDGIKLFVECFKRYTKREFSFDRSQVSAVICAYNEQGVIGKTLEGLKQILPEEQIIVVDDGSNDKTSEEIIESGKNIQLVRIENIGKVGALKKGLEKVKTPFTLILDADIHLDKDFRLPTSLLRENTAAAFNVVPEKPIEKISRWSNLLLQLQTHEYAKSMQIGKRAEDTIASVHCVSGAAGLYQTERLKKLSAFHSEIFTSEDLERTLIELAADGKIIFIDQPVKTDVPLSLRELIKQRLISWWPGLYRTIPLFFKILFKRGSAPILRMEMLYEIFSLATDPLKILSLIVLAVYGNWRIIFLVYSIYLAIETAIYFRINSKYLEKAWMVLPTYMIYNIFQMFLRTGAFAVFVWKRWIKKEWKGVKTDISLLTN